MIAKSVALLAEEQLRSSCVALCQQDYLRISLRNKIQNETIHCNSWFGLLVSPKAVQTTYYLPACAIGLLVLGNIAIRLHLFETGHVIQM